MLRGSSQFKGDAYLLVDVPITWTPTKLWVVAPCTIDGGLRVYCQETKFVHLGELQGDGGGFGRCCLIRPWEGLETAQTESTK